jgi:hypothetical protein
VPSSTRAPEPAAFVGTAVCVCSDAKRSPTIKEALCGGSGFLPRAGFGPRWRRHSGVMLGVVRKRLVRPLDDPVDLLVEGDSEAQEVGEMERPAYGEPALVLIQPDREAVRRESVPVREDVASLGLLSVAPALGCVRRPAWSGAVRRGRPGAPLGR